MDKIKITKKIVSSKIIDENKEESFQISSDKELKEHKSFHLANCKSVSDFEKIEEIGEGTYGTVCKKF